MSLIAFPFVQEILLGFKAYANNAMELVKLAGIIPKHVLLVLLPLNFITQHAIQVAFLAFMKILVSVCSVMSDAQLVHL